MRARLVAGMLCAALLSGVSAESLAVVKKPVAKRPPARKPVARKPAAPKPAPAPIPPLGPAPMPWLKFGEAPVGDFNKNLGPGETLWHVRAALNVAALSCRAPQYAMLGPDYNKMLRLHKLTLKTAVGAETTRYGAGFANDRHQTQLYNYFSAPVGTAQLCWSASQLLAKIGAMTSGDLSRGASKILAELEAPFLPPPPPPPPVVKAPDPVTPATADNGKKKKKKKD